MPTIPKPKKKRQKRQLTRRAAETQALLEVMQALDKLYRRADMGLLSVMRVLGCATVIMRNQTLDVTLQDPS